MHKMALGYRLISTIDKQPQLIVPRQPQLDSLARSDPSNAAAEIAPQSTNLVIDREHLALLAF